MLKSNAIMQWMSRKINMHYKIDGEVASTNPSQYILALYTLVCGERDLIIL